MAEYIERETAIEKTEAFCDVFVTKWTDEKVIAWIRNLPAADVAPVVHGRWQRESVPIKNMEIVRYRDTCSECGAKAEFLYRDSHYNFCHNCGAKMDGE